MQLCDRAFFTNGMTKSTSIQSFNEASEPIIIVIALLYLNYANTYN